VYKVLHLVVAGAVGERQQQQVVGALGRLDPLTCHLLILCLIHAQLMTENTWWLNG